MSVLLPTSIYARLRALAQQERRRVQAQASVALERGLEVMEASHEANREATEERNFSDARASKAWRRRV